MKGEAVSTTFTGTSGREYTLRLNFRGMDMFEAHTGRDFWSTVWAWQADSQENENSDLDDGVKGLQSVTGFLEKFGGAGAICRLFFWSICDAQGVAPSSKGPVTFHDFEQDIANVKVTVAFYNAACEALVRFVQSAKELADQKPSKEGDGPDPQTNSPGPGAMSGN